MLYQLSYAHHYMLLTTQPCQMARPAGLEPATIRLEGGCSIQLSYGAMLRPDSGERGSLQSPACAICTAA